jgi:hypothetical protein
MEKLSKITVKHFLNPRVIPTDYILGGLNEEGVQDDDLVPHPLYVKVTFKRNSTEIRSILRKDFYSLFEIKREDKDLMEVETRMIEDIIAKEYKKHGDKFSLKGIKKKSEFYEKELIEHFSNDFLWNDYQKLIVKSRSEFSRLLLNRDPSVSASIYFKAAMKLIPGDKGLEKFQGQFEVLEQINGIFRKMKGHGMIIIASWKYGKVKDQFASIGLQMGLGFAKVQKLTALIDTVIEKGE